MVAATRKADLDKGIGLAEGPEGHRRMSFGPFHGIPWRRIERRPQVRAYLAAFDAYVRAGGSNAPAFVTALRESALADLKGVK
jgi:hypothetical protein